MVLGGMARFLFRMAGGFWAVRGKGRIWVLRYMLICGKKHNNIFLYNGKGSKSPSKCY